ncbi:peptidoglycan-recognition protein SC2-like [Gigantopelta aegis]|uniref:peptidoglycan-recognition protein SC2-like n=1 Tax=Gigantopelta aegis TaxID=1735272 RepID=UPI001B889B42|nr:peptidoglycan-recognition protein SC2-like [Gigantopelta aegis]
MLLLWFICASLVPPTLGRDCACATGSVHVRSGAGVGHSSLGILSPGQCVTYRGNQVQNGGLQWARVEYNGHDAYVAANWLRFQACSGATTNSQQLPGCPRIISRAEWGAREPSTHIPDLAHTPQMVYIHHGATRGCTTQNECAAIVRSYQNYHMDTHGWDDIGYTFVIGEDGNIYEARGWDKFGTHTRNHNHDGLGFCVIGDFTSHVPNTAAQNAVKQLIQCAVDNGKIRHNYIVKGHRDVVQTSCPGTKFYELIHSWPHYMKDH